MQNANIFVRKLARKVRLDELGKIGGGIVKVETGYWANSCAASGGTDGEYYYDGPIFN